LIKKILFWLFVIAVGFVNPLISVALIVLYYLPKIISDFTMPCEPERDESFMKSYSDDVIEDMK
jgi:hypothetical protein